MNLVQLLAAVAFQAVRNKGHALKLEVIQEWIKDNSNRDNYGAGYTGNRLSSNRGNSYAEVRRESVNGGIRVTANVYFDAKQGAAATKTWNAKQLDAKLEKFFGHHMRVRLDV